MPTAARLVAAICLGILAFVVSGLVMPLMPEGRSVGPWFTPVNVIVGLLSGWIVMGPRAGRGVVWGINNGLTGMAAMVFWGLFVHSTDEMVRLAMRNRYDGPFEAILAIFYVGLDFARMIVTGGVIVTLLAGGVAAGLVTEYAKGRWR
ncbi:MAG: tellurium resistance protein [Rhodobacteraceae bacterium]|nr:tellurium resistance protein [Paracoccaceae bacterium]MAY47059.1 tellurium resistance protein [Paracoccaceae bacterium]